MIDYGRRLHAVVEQAAIGIAVADLDGRILEANPAFERMLGCEPGQLGGVRVREITHPEDAPETIVLLEELVAGRRESYDVEKRYVRRDGSVFWGRVVASLVRDEAGSPELVVATIEAIDDRKQAEQALAEAEARYRTLVEELPLVTYIDALDERSSNIYTSPQLEPILGYTVEEWQSDPDLFVRVLHPDDRDRVLEQVRAANETGERFSSEYRLIACDGRVVWVRDECVTVRGPDGTPLHSQGYLLDITERKASEDALRASEERFRAMADDAPVLIWTTDAEGSVTFVSRGWLEFTGRPEGDHLGDGWLEHIHPNDRPTAGAAYREAILGGRTFEAEYRLRRHDGEYRWLHDVGRPQLASDGSVAGYVGVAVDVTERKLAQEELERRERILSAVARIAGELMTASRWDEADLVEALGEAAETSRAYVFQRLPGVEPPTFRCVAEWTADGIAQVAGDPARARSQHRAAGLGRLDGLLRGEVVAGSVRDFPERERAAWARLGVVSALAVPVFVEAEWWGYIGFDECVEERRWSGGEVDALRVAAGLLGAAIHHERAAEALRESEERFAAFMDTTPAVAWAKDTEGRYVYVNARWREFFGHRIREVVGRTDDDLFPDQAEQFREHDAAALAAGKPIAVQERVDLDGRELALMTFKFPFRDAADREYVGGTALDITEQERAAEALRETSHTLEAIVDSSPLAIVAFDRDGCVTRWNAAAEQIFGWTREEALGRFNPLLPDGEAETFERALERALEGRSWRNVEARRLRKDGAAIDVSVSSAPLRGASGEIEGMVTVLADVTDQKRAARRLDAQHAVSRALAESATVSEAGARIVEEVCSALEWDVGSLWLVDRDADVLGLAAVRDTGEPRLAPFVQATRERTYRRGEGLPGRTWEQASPTWIGDLETWPNAVRGAAVAAAGLRGAFATPIISEGEVLGVLEFFSTSIWEPDRPLLAMLESVGGQIAQFVRRAEAATALRDREERFRTLVSNLPGALYRCAADADWTMEFMSDAIEEIVGYPASDFVGNAVRSFESVIVPEDREPVHRAVDEAISRGEPFELEYEVVHADGSRRWVSEKGQAVHDAEGRIAWLDGAIFDVTERKRAEAALAQERELMRIFMETTPDHIYFKDLESRFLRISKALATWLGLEDPEHAIGKTDFDFFTAEHAAKARADELELIRSGEPMIDVEDRETWPDGTETWVVSSRLPLRDEQGHVVGTFGISRDVTERKRSEQALADARNVLESIVENLPVMVFLKDADDLRFVLVNRAMEEITGLGRDVLVGRSDRDLFAPEEAEFFMAKDREVLESGTPLQIPEEQLGERVLHTVKVPILGEDGRPRYLLGISGDITEAKRATEERERLVSQLEEQNEQLRELDAMKDEFVALVSHELRTPLTSILGYLELVLDGDAGEITDDQRHFLGIIQRNADRLLRLVGDLLFVAQIEAGKLSIDREPVDLVAIARDCIEAAGPLAGEKGIDLRLGADAEAPLAGDRVRLAQLLDNLISNAIKFTAEGGRVEVRVARGHRRCTIAVSDTGMGIPKAEQAALFQRFYRTSEATRRAIQGTGLGLTITKAIAEAHGGRIAVESEEGCGTTFLVDLPAPPATSSGDAGVPIEP